MKERATRDSDYAIAAQQGCRETGYRCLDCPLPQCWYDNPQVLMAIGKHPRQVAQAEATAAGLNIRDWVRQRATSERVTPNNIIKRYLLVELVKEGAWR